jgi:hypothetical protein
VGKLYCTQCGAENEAASTECSRCGEPLFKKASLNNAFFTEKPLLITCPACQSEVSSQALSCPKCGQPISSVSDSAPSYQQMNPPPAFRKLVQPPKRRGCGRNLGIGCLGLLGLMVVIRIIGDVSSPTNRDAPSPTPPQTVTVSPTPLGSPSVASTNSNQSSGQDFALNEDIVYVAINRYLRDNLNDPSSLDDLQILGISPVRKSGGYRVVAFYRAKNGFGALVANQQKFILTKAPMGTGNTLFFNVRPE